MDTIWNYWNILLHQQNVLTDEKWNTEAMLEGQDCFLSWHWTAQNTTLKSAKIALKSLQNNLFSNKEIAQPYLDQIRQCHCENDYSKLQNKSFKVGEPIKRVNSPTTLV